jgi:hypothetical protein
MFRPLEDGVHIGLLLASDAFCNKRSKRPIIAVDAGRQPERDAKAVTALLGKDDRHPARRRL